MTLNGNKDRKMLKTTNITVMFKIVYVKKKDKLYIKLLNIYIYICTIHRAPKAFRVSGYQEITSPRIQIRNNRKYSGV